MRKGKYETGLFFLEFVILPLQCLLEIALNDESILSLVTRSVWGLSFYFFLSFVPLTGFFFIFALTFFCALLAEATGTFFP